jgi:pyruvate,orthophosphate dikinase
MAKRVYLFSEGSKDDRDLLGGKGANLCEMTRLGLPVPFGFVITTPTCREYFENGNRLPLLLEQEYRVALDLVEKQMGARFGDPENPLLFSVRSGAPDLHAGHDEHDPQPRHQRRDRRWPGASAPATRASPTTAIVALSRCSPTWCSVPTHMPWKQVIVDYKKQRGYRTDVEMQAEDWQAVIERFKTMVEFPEDPFVQLLARRGCGVQVLVHTAGQCVSRDEQHPRLAGHGGQRAVHGVRQLR